MLEIRTGVFVTLLDCIIGFIEPLCRLRTSATIKTVIFSILFICICMRAITY